MAFVSGTGKSTKLAAYSEEAKWKDILCLVVDKRAVAITRGVKRRRMVCLHILLLFDMRTSSQSRIMKESVVAFLEALLRCQQDVTID